jgi:hypothetical protein
MWAINLRMWLLCAAVFVMIIGWFLDVFFYVKKTYDASNALQEEMLLSEPGIWRLANSTLYYIDWRTV